MPAAALLLPVALLAGGAVVARLAARAQPRFGQGLAAALAWAALLALVLLWLRPFQGFPERTPLDLTVGELGAGIRLAVRLDAVSFAFGLFLLLPVSVLLTVLRSPSPPLALLAAATSLLSLEASGLILAIVAWGATFLAVGLLLQAGGESKPTAMRLRDQFSILLLVWAAAAIYSRGGTDQYAAIPISAISSGIFALVALSALLAAGLVPWKSWPSVLWDRFRPETAGLAIALTLFTGFYFLVRMYQAGGGHYPNGKFNSVLSLLGVVCLLAATLRAQAAPTRRAYLAETLPTAGGFALLALGLGTPLGVAAAIGSLAVTSLLAALLPLVPEETLSPSLMLVLLLAVGLPPTAVFGIRLLDIQAAIEANEVAGYLGLAAAVGWVVGIAAAARAVRLGSIPSAAVARGHPGGVLLLGALLSIGGAGMGVLQAGLAIPVASTVVGFPRSALTGGIFAVAAASGSWRALALGGLVMAALIALAVAGRAEVVPAGAGELPRPFVEPRWRGIPDRLGALADRFEIPAEFQVTGWQRIDRAMTGGSIWFWIAVLLVLALVVR